MGCAAADVACFVVVGHARSVQRMLGIVFCLCISFTASKGIIQVECKAAVGIQQVALTIASCILRLVERGLQLSRSVVLTAVVVGYDVDCRPTNMVLRRSREHYFGFGESRGRHVFQFLYSLGLT